MAAFVQEHVLVGHTFLLEPAGSGFLASNMGISNRSLFTFFSFFFIHLSGTWRRYVDQRLVSLTLLRLLFSGST